MKIRWIHFISIIVLLSQCAKQTSPTGGPTDETPPKLKSSYPTHEQVNFKGNRIELFFDEPIQLSNAREQIIITPSVGKKFEVTFSKNRVTLDLKEVRLQENTTYNINFREAIQDLTEKNPAVVKLAFSTGSYIDSLSINGKIQDALTEKLQTNYTVALAETSDTFNIFKHPASWITVTNKKGFFSLENLKPGTYILYTFDDRSKNLIIDSKSEQYGFVGQQINLTKNIDSLRLRTFKQDINELKLITARTTFAYFNLRFSKSLINYKVTAVDSTIQVYSSLEPDLTTIKLYNTIPDLDSLQIKVNATDSLNTTVDTVVYMKFPKKEATRDKFVPKLEKVSVYESNSLLSTQILFNKPLSKFSPDSIFIEIDSLTKVPLSQQDYSWENNQTKLLIRKKVDLKILFPPDSSKIESPKSKPETPKSSISKGPKKPPTLLFLKGAFISIENDTAQTLSSTLSVTTLESTAIIETKVETSENFIIQLLTKAGKIVGEQINQKSFMFENLPADTYLLRIVVDTNKNGKWDPGDFKNRIEPEPIIYYRNPKAVKEISLKANWQLGPLLITY
jgi:uncharacterized protein (DUF2141 family)